ncbi:DNA repair protein RAD50-like isoform X2 [Salvia splendens]|uniref:DNA repair protein RAD50-like isoform X2 n=1 Tax=Salvia splendens TaxID=180675 RepID=UPI001C263AAC|nr:DNA repair protein RAD50-like isoform X2 [Salvia splendens]
MSTVDKMLIKGIRSFDPENKNVITFFRPLTLIVGPNGAGKTTIIECLKVACTGELPPNARSGHSFVHDPKVAGETETKGQIKLRFKTAARKDVVCIRSFQLTQKATKMEYKAIESVLQTINPQTGEKVCLSYRCADMDREIPALMGVSKAVLENVIFVHQDEANWPLQDPSTLKKKFDDIFSATRYTKALEVIKKLHKDQAQEIKTYKLKLDHLQTLKDAAFKLRESIAQYEVKTATLNSQIEELDPKIQNIDREINKTELLLKDLRELQGQIATKSGERKSKFEDVHKRYSDLDEENEDTDEELNEWKSKFDERIAVLENKVNKLLREKMDNKETSRHLEDDIAKNIKEIAKLQALIEAQLSQKDKRDSTIRSIIRKHNLGSLPSGPLSDDVCSSLTDRIQSMLKDLHKDLQDKKKANKLALDALFDKYMHANDRWKRIEAQKEAKVERKNNILNSIQEKENVRDSFEGQIAAVDMSVIDERERNMQIEVERKSNQLAAKDFAERFKKMKLERFKLEQEIEALDHQRNTMESDSHDRVVLSVKKADLENVRKKHRRTMNECKDRVTVVLKGRIPPDKDLKNEIVEVQSSLQKEYDDLEKKADEARNEVAMLKLKIQEVNSNLSKFHHDLGSRRRFVESKLQSLDPQAGGIDSYLKMLETAKERRDDLSRDYNISDGMGRMFEPFEKIASTHHYCPCCERPFSSNEEDAFIKKQRVKALDLTERLKLLEVQSSNTDFHFQQLDKLRVVYDEYVKTGKELIPLAEKNLHDLNEDLDLKHQALDDVLGVLAQIKAEKDSVDALIQPVGTVDRLFQEMQALQKQVNELESKLDIQAQGQDAKSLEEIISELKSLEKERNTLIDDTEKLRTEQMNMEKEISSLQSRWSIVREEKINVANILSNIKRVEDELDSLLEDKSQVDLDLKHLEEDLAPLAREKEKLRDEHKKLEAELNREYDLQAKNHTETQLEVNALLEMVSTIKKNESLNKGEELKALQAKQTVAKSNITKCQTRMNEIEEELEKSKDLIRSQAELRRNIQQNLDYREAKAQLDELTREIESLEDSVLKIGGVSKFESLLLKNSQERDSLLKELNSHRGTLSVYKSNIDQSKADLKQAQYKDIDKRYFDQLIQLKTTEMANKDLDRYYKALDKALMRFHSMKMEEINKIIRELWQQTYRGQDIDYISIHSDSDGAGTRSYSYRVLMQTGDAQLEMRGRCSAGQKVLASLIIRLALAETFCLNCGILALDEPTTNLDGPNSESLAAALLRIMEDRRGQENFQLIVITHDERFAQLIGQRQHAEKYYRISKDDYQHSIIESQEIFD